MTPTLSLLVLLTVAGPPQGEASVTPWLADPPASVGRLDPPARLDPDIPSPGSTLGYPPGARFTPHHRLLEVIDQLAAASPRLRVEPYGRSVEDRPLRLVVASAPRHLERLDAILDTRRRAVTTGDLGTLRDLPAVVWVGFGIHGNETSSSEAAMAVLHLLAAAEDGSGPASWLDQLIVIVDPVANPDGRERYVQWYRSVRGQTPDADARALEHREPWPGGRQNHYLFDLNRDWAWATQVETRARLAAFQRFQPDVAIDVHEMRPDATYFFPPAADPAHQRIPTSVHDWLTTFGRANAEAFDRRAWPYFVREVYDFFYPGYGDTYPSLIGAVGMTFEMAGGGRAGARLDLDDGRRRTLAGRTARHTLTVLTTLKTAAADPRGLARDAVARRRDAGAGAYIWSATQAEASALAELLTVHGIPVGRLGSERSLDVEPILPGARVSRTFDRDAFVAVAEPPHGRLLHALMERSAQLRPAFVDRQRARIEAGLGAEIYDVTAWSLPLAYGVETWRLDSPVETVADQPTPPTWPLADAARQGWLVRPQGLVGYRLAARLLADGIRLRRLVEPEPSPALPGGSLFIPRHANPSDVEAHVERAVAETGAHIEAAGSAWTDDGPSLGSGRWRPIDEPRVGLIAGRGIDITGHGHLWHLVDQQIRFPVTRLDIDRLDRLDLADFDVLILPDGDYSAVGSERFGAWLRAGGTAVAIAGAADWLRDENWSRIQIETVDDDAKTPPGLLDVQGAIVATRLSSGHRLAAGRTEPPAVLYRGQRVWQPFDDPTIDVLTVREESPVLAGLVWPEAEERLRGALLVADERVGQGRIVAFAFDPAFRGFWRATMPLLLDAILFPS